MKFPRTDFGCTTVPSSGVYHVSSCMLSATSHVVHTGSPTCLCRQMLRMSPCLARTACRASGRAGPGTDSPSRGTRCSLHRLVQADSGLSSRNASVQQSSTTAVQHYARTKLSCMQVTGV